MLTVHFKNYLGKWEKDNIFFSNTEKKKAEKRLKTIIKTKALNGQAEIFSI